MFLVWMFIAHHDPDDIVVGAIAAVLAARVSLALLPAGALRPRAVPALRLAARILAQSAAAGIDIALRACRPAMGLRPGIVFYPTRLAEGVRRQAFGTLMSLCPGTLPLGTDSGGTRLVHCLDTGQDVPGSMLGEEAGFGRVFPAPSLAPAPAPPPGPGPGNAGGRGG